MKERIFSSASFPIRLVLVFMLLAVALRIQPVPVAHAATINVNTTDDELNNDGDCSLREAIRAANTDAAVDACPAGCGADTINLPAGTYNLTIAGAGEDAALTGDLDITQNLTINGAGAATTVIDGGGLDRVFHALSGNVTFSNVTIRNGNVTGNGAGIEYGSVGFSGGTLTIQNATISGNTATASGGGANIFSGCNSCTINITNSTFDGNSTGDDGGGFHVRSANNVTVNITDSTFQNNTASDAGGALYLPLSSSTINITGSTFTGNTAGTGASGGAITGPNVNVWNITNSTFSGNTAGASGGAIAAANGTYNLNNLTITNNTADVAPGGFAGNGGGISASSWVTVNVKNTIVAGNTDIGGQAPDCSGTLNSQGYNLIQNTAGCTIGGDPTGNITGQNPNLGPLALNPPGTTATHALLAGSPAIDTANPAVPGSGGNACEATDQRGVARPQPTGGDCDIGAFELEQAPPAPVGGVSAPVSRLALLAPWLGLAALVSLAALTVALVRRHRA